MNSPEYFQGLLNLLLALSLAILFTSIGLKIWFGRSKR